MMDFKTGQEVDYAGHVAKIIGIIPAFFVAGSFPDGVDDIDIRYLELDFDKTAINADTVLIEADRKLIRVLPTALKEIAVKKTKKKGK